AAERPDVVVIATGTEFHYPLAMQALESGAHVDLEKPVAVDLEQADDLVERSLSLGRQVAVHHQGRVGGSVGGVRRWLAEGQIGALRHMTGSCKGYYGGYGLMNIGCQLISYFLAGAGLCRAVVASATTAGRPVRPEDVVTSPLGMGTILGEKITAALEFD